MKTLLSKVAFIVCLLSIQHSNFAYSQSKYQGEWKGKFMNDFKTILEIGVDENDNFSGKIKMFSGPDLIQDDPISNISVSEHILTFRINAKDTDFKGEFNSDISEITGVFIFPDNTEHPLKLVKNVTNELSAGSSPESFLDIRNKRYSVDELWEDFDFLIRQLKAFHPQLYAYISEKEFNKRADEIKKSINQELSIIEYFNLIAPVVEHVKCSHTGVRLPMNYEQEINSHDNFLPIKLLFDGSKIYCLKNYDNRNTAISPGDEILSINNNSIQNIKEKIYRFIPSEGNNLTTKNYQLNQNFNSYFNWIDNSDQFEIEFVNADSKQSTTIQACSYSTIEAEKEAPLNEIPIDFFIDKKNDIGLLTVRSFMVGDINSYIQKMDGIFTSLQNKNTQQLVIDLRGNSGGHPIFAAQLFSYLTREDFIYFKRNNEVKEFEPLYNKMQPNDLQFKGNIYVFVDGGCLSTTGHLISLLKYHTNAIFVGQEPGSTYRCNDFSLKETLRNTKIEVNIPRTTFETAVSESFKSIPFLVDYEVNFSIEDYLAGVDSYLKFVDNLVLKP